MKNYSLLIVFLFLLISNSFGKSNKNKDDQSPEIIKIIGNDKLPLYYEIVISGHFSIDKTGLTVSYLGDKIHDFQFIKGELLNKSGEPTTNSTNVSISPDKLIEDEFELFDNSDFSTQSPTSKPTTTPSQTVPPTSTPTSTPSKSVPPSSTPSTPTPPTPSPTSSPTSTPSKSVPPSSTPSTPTPTSTPSSSSTQTPTITSTPSKTVPPKPTKSSKPTKTPTPTTLPTTAPSIVKGYDIIKFNLTDIEDVNEGKIAISYKNGQSSSKHFEPNSIIKSIERVNSLGGVVEFKGSFFYTDDYEPQITIGNKSCETLTSSQSSIRCYLSNGTGCDHSIVIDNLLNAIDIKGNRNLTYCYANPIIDKVIGYKDKKDTKITIIGKNFLNNATVVIEKPNGHKRNCSNNIILSTDTVFICSLGESYDKELTSSSKLTNATILSLININSPNSSIVSNEIIEMISGYFQIKISTKPSINDEGEVDNGSVGKSVIDNSKGSNSQQKGSKKLYLVIILPTVLFIIVATLVAIFIKTRVQNSQSVNKKDNINLPFQMLEEMTT
ncbi:hypothetical protein RB653_007496 [Dictyostelium firmibasis]|uniref:IPT/TIG domain-containing protein n=1 Tax=Dictyostelium firmibasis TaxID=79012 RepID=A0AAN7TWK8_9MYCE